MLILIEIWLCGWVSDKNIDKPHPLPPTPSKSIFLKNVSKIIPNLSEFVVKLWVIFVKNEERFPIE